MIRIVITYTEELNDNSLIETNLATTEYNSICIVVMYNNERTTIQ